MMKNNLLKDDLRKRINGHREILSVEEKKRFDEKIYYKLIGSDFYKSADIVFIYVSFGKEVDTLKIISKLLKDNKKVYVPKVINKKEGMKAIKIKSLEDLNAGYFNILEPIGNEELQPSYFDLCIVPGLAFDNEGGRLGYGGGFYDRFLGDVSEKTEIVALAYNFQIVDKVPMEPYDIRVQGIITT